VNGSDLALPISAVYVAAGAPPISPDFENDGDVDLTDFGHFRNCFNGPNRPYAQTGCANADFDADSDVDLDDFEVFLRCFNGPNRRPRASRKRTVWQEQTSGVLVT